MTEVNRMTHRGWAIVTGASGGMGAAFTKALAAYDAGRVVRVVGLTNRLLAISGALTPRFILRWLMARMFAPTNAGAESTGPPKRRPQVS